MISTNTISQGDTREGALVPILAAGGTIIRCIKRLKWPGEAAVMVSLLHITKGWKPPHVVLDGSNKSRISAFLVDGNQDETPERLASNPYFSLGVKIYGQGFLFDDNDTNSSPLNRMQELLRTYPQLQDRIRPYIGGEDLNSRPTPTSERYAIYLSDVNEEVALDDLLPLADIVREKVLPERMQLGNNPNNVQLKRRWWAYQAHRPKLQSELKGLKSFLAISQVTSHLAFTFCPTTFMPSQKVVVIAADSMATFGLLQSRAHEVWVRFFSSTMKDDLNYAPSDCFQNFPMPKGHEEIEALIVAGNAYYDHRAALMIARDEGLTRIYNRFHDRTESAPDIVRLRALHQDIDLAVLRAYRWDDLADRIAPEFLAEESEPEHRYQGRMFWPSDFRDEVIGRLLALNAECAAEERRAGLASIKAEEVEEVDA